MDLMRAVNDNWQDTQSAEINRPRPDSLIGKTGEPR
jgi:hypothetical protein